MDDLMQMAEEAGFNLFSDGLRDDGSRSTYLDCWPEQLAAFAQLVAKKAVEAEREACARVCEAQENKVAAPHPARIEFDPNSMMARKCATAIRSRALD